jgi:hypothetical protein
VDRERAAGRAIQLKIVTHATIAAVPVNNLKVTHFAEQF